MGGKTGPGVDVGGARPDEPSTQAEFAEFYQASYRRVTTQVYAYIGNAAEAEDVAQEAYLRAWHRWSVVSRYDDPVAWVRRVAWNLATSRLRRVAVATRVLRRQPRPDVVAALSPDHVALVAALRTLTHQQRQVIVLHYFADMAVADIVAELNTPRGTVLSWLSRGRARLAEQLGEAESVHHVAAATSEPDGGERHA